MHVKMFVNTLFRIKIKPAGMKMILGSPESIQSVTSATSPAKLLTPFLYWIGLLAISLEMLKLVTVLAIMLSMLATIDIPMKNIRAKVTLDACTNKKDDPISATMAQVILTRVMIIGKKAPPLKFSM